jgi:hypothetical protein
MEKNSLFPEQRKRSTKSATPTTTDLNPRKRPALKVPAPGLPGIAAPDITAAKTDNGLAIIRPAERQEMIAIAAYYRAARHGFRGGSAEQDWLEAEAEVDQVLSQQRK